MTQSPPHIVSEPTNTVEARFQWLCANNFTAAEAAIQYIRGTVCYASYVLYLKKVQ